ncbi:cell division protein ZapA [Salidesulfovibrio brasiliensis]|uniref:cell division protein ZapA n=1 Tax=Salidesulfovibrio brasiliensis TaxID=221711 RepID=UPI0006D0C3B6|nr:cell division protein ZapA [Salidesulfovibrio brasiliensis]
MPRYSLSLVGLEISFRTDADAERIEAAQALVEERFADLSKSGSDISKEKLLTFLALSLADDYLVLQERQAQLEKKITELLEMGAESVQAD